MTSFWKAALVCKQPCQVRTTPLHLPFAEEKTEVQQNRWEGHLSSPVDPDSLPVTMSLTPSSTRKPWQAQLPWPTCTPSLPAPPPVPCPCLPTPTHNVHEGEQVLLHMLLPVELDHRVIHPQQDLDVVVVVGSMSAHPLPGAVDSLLQDAQGMAEAVQAAREDPWKETGQSL